MYSLFSPSRDRHVGRATVATIATTTRKETKDKPTKEIKKTPYPGSNRGYQKILFE